MVGALQAARESARRMQCANHLKQTGLSIHNFEDANKVLVPARMENYGGVTWAVFILPYLEQTAFAQQWDLNRWYYDQGPNGNITRQTQLKVMYCPSRQRNLKLSQNNDIPEVAFSGAPANVNVPGA